MISRFSARRLLCCLMAALTLFGALSPALCQPAEAVAVADDVLIASLGLLAMSWAGISFSSCAGAQTAVNSFLASKPAAKLSLAGLLTKGLVTEGTKLLLTRDVRDAFSAVLPDIKTFFKTDSDEVVSSGSGNLLTLDVQPAYIDVSDSCNNFSYAFSNNLIPNSLFYQFSFDTFDYAIFATSYKTFFYKNSDGYTISQNYYSYPSNGSFGYVCLRRNGHVVAGPSIIYFNPSGEPCTAGFQYSLMTLHFRDDVSYSQSKEVDGTSALEILKPAPLYVVNPGGSSGGDGSQKPEIDFSKVAFISLAGLYGLLGLSGNDALKDPGLDPEQMVDQLKKAMESTQTEPKPDPDPQPDPDPDTPGGSSGTAPDFNGMMLPGLKDFFPFCIPFDLKKMMDALCADPVAPKFTFATSFLGQVYTVDIDLSAWDGVATTVRYMVVATYIVCLAVATRKFIKW